jgi:hypothetical protein
VSARDVFELKHAKKYPRACVWAAGVARGQGFQQRDPQFLAISPGEGLFGMI